MRLVSLTDSYPPVINGVSNVVQNLSENMVKRGHEVKVITIDSKFDLPQTEIQNGVLVRRFPGLRPGGSYHIPSPEIYREIRKYADVVHIHNFHSVMPLVGSFSLNGISSKTKKVVTPHYHTMGHHFHSRLAWIPYKPLLDRALRNFDAIHCVSKFESNIVNRDFMLQSVVIENGIPSDVYDHQRVYTYANKKELKVLFVGRLEKYKRVDLLVEAVALVKNSSTKETEPDLTVIGSGPEAPHIMNLAQRLGVKLMMESRVSRSDLLSLYSTASCLVNCSEFEAFSIVVAEALAMGTPAVVVYPWGTNFKNYERAAIVQPKPESVAGAIMTCKDLEKKPLRHVPTWDETTSRMVSEVYQ